MSPTTTENLEYLALDGPIGLKAAVVLAIVLLALFAWALWRERPVLGPRYTVLFWLLRSAALGTVIWMLLAPNNVRVETSTTRRIVAVATDVSGSMQTVDPPGTSDDVRWAVSRDTSGQYVATEAADRAIAAHGMAVRHLQAAIAGLEQHRPESAVIEAALSANGVLDRVKSHVVAVRDASAAPGGAGQSRSLARRILATCEGAEFRAFEQLCQALEKGRTPSQKGWRESLPDLLHRLEQIRRPLQELARQVVKEEANRVAQRNPELLTSVRNASRLKRASEFLGRLDKSALQSIRDKADVGLSAFADAVRLLPDSQPPGDGLKSFLSADERSANTASATDLTALLEELHRSKHDQPLAAVVLLTDAAHNQSGTINPREAASKLQETPVYVVPIGNPEHVRDVVLQSVSAPAIVMRNDQMVIEVGVQAFDCEGEVCMVQLLQDGEVVDFREVVLDSAFASRTVRFEQRMPSVGEEKFQVAIAPVAGELTDENNYDEFEVQVTRSDIKVLLADEVPRWEYRYLAQLFRRDPKVECDELLFHPRMIATGRREETKTFPVTTEEWNQYDVVILGDLTPQHLPVASQESLVEYLRKRGGTVVLIAGRDAMPQAYQNDPLGEIIPVQPVEERAGTDAGGYAFQVTEEGREHHALLIGETEEATRVAWDFVNRFSPFYELSPWRRPRPSARTLIAAVPRRGQPDGVEASESAFLCWHPVGRGRAVYLSAPDTYRLRFLRGDRFHYRFWGQLLRWAIASDLAAGSKFVRIRTDRSRYDSRDTVRVTVQLQDAEGEPVVADDLEVRAIGAADEHSAPLRAQAEIPGEYVAELRSLPSGVYRVEPHGAAVEELQQESEQEPASASFTVQTDLPQEFVDTRSDRALAQQLADITGGQVVPPTAVSEILELTNLEPIVAERVERRPLWLQWKYLWIVFGCLQIEWVIRKWKGLS